jgi:hypothetical protein
MNYKKEYKELNKEQRKEFKKILSAVFKLKSKQAIWYHISKERDVKALEHHFITNLFKKVKG